jgi:hypothetical protein
VVDPGSNDPGSAKDPGSNDPGSNDPGSNDPGSNDPGSNGSNTVVAEGVKVKVLLKNVGGTFDVIEDGTKIFEGPGDITIPKGGSRTVTIQVSGYEPKVVKITDGKPKVEVRLTKIVKVPQGCPATACPANQVCKDGKCKPKDITPPPVDCTSVIVDPKNKACVRQYCKGHPNVPACDLED